MESLHCSLNSETKEETAALRKKVELLGSKMEEFEDTSKSAFSRPKRAPRDLSEVVTERGALFSQQMFFAV